MNTDTFYKIHTSRPRIHANQHAVVAELHRDYPMHTRGEIVDALETAQYDVPTARQFCEDARAQGISLAIYLAQYEEVTDDR